MRNRKVNRVSWLMLPVASLLTHASFATTAVACRARPGLSPDALYRIHEEVPAGAVRSQLDRIGTACAERKDPSCSVIETGFTTASGVIMGRVLMRVSSTDLALITGIATTGAKVTNEEHHVDHQPMTADRIEADIAKNAANRQRINELLSGRDTSVALKIELNRELADAEEELTLLQMSRAALSKRSTFLVIEMNIPTPAKASIP